LTKKAGIIIASADAVSLDRVAVEAVGLNHRDFHMNRIAGERRYGESDIDNITILGNSISDFSEARFKAPENRYNSMIFKMLKIKRLRNMLLEYPIIIPDLCIRCGECVKICPPKVMTFRGKYPAADKAKCIRCWCCTEVCPQNAITKSKKPFLGKILLRHFK
jgi:ferredoxin